jgi:hypothetical protein
MSSENVDFFLNQTRIKFFDQILTSNPINNILNVWSGYYNNQDLVHLPNDTMSIAFECTVFLLIPKENTTVSIGSVLK